MFSVLIKKLIGSANERLIKSHDKAVSIINDIGSRYHAMSDEELRDQTRIFREKLAKGAKEFDILPEAFAAVREAAVRTTGMKHFDVQLIGGMVLNTGMIAK